MVSESGQMVWLQVVCSETKLQADGSEKTERKLWFCCGWQMCSCSVTKLQAVCSETKLQVVCSVKMIWKQSAEKMNEQDLNGYWTEHQPGEL